jgi:AcrR family transcriptional regulator
VKRKVGRKSIKETRQKEIIAAFYQVAKLEGLENASIAKVARVLDINPSLIIHYFSSKEELIFGLIEYILDQYQLIYNRENGQTDSRKRLIKIIDNLFSHQWNNLIDDGVFYSCYALIFRDGKIKDHFKQLHDKLHEWLADHLTEACRNNVISLKNPRQTANMIFVIIDGAYYYLGMLDNEEAYEEKINYYKQVALELLGLSDQSSS